MMKVAKHDYDDGDRLDLGEIQTWEWGRRGVRESVCERLFCRLIQ